MQRSWSDSLNGPPTIRTVTLPELGPSGGKTPSIATSGSNVKSTSPSSPDEKLACAPAPLFETATRTTVAPSPSAGGVMQTSAELLKNLAATTVIAAAVPKRHVSSAELRKCSPWTITSVPPCSGPWLGMRPRTRTIGRYSNTTPLAALKSCPFCVTSSATTPPASVVAAVTISRITADACVPSSPLAFGTSIGTSPCER